ncbi:MAG: Hsp20/alpha crystallin family protein [Bacilli bacterium]|nr:Hsp20/alpha crystallin family protein [Bacilli bacterium]
MHLIPKNTFFREIFDDLFDMPIMRSGDIMRSDIYEEDDNYVVEMDIPGFNKEDLLVDYNNGYLNIIAKKETEQEENKNYIRRERYYGEYKRSFYVGDIDESLIKANFENGILKVIFPKKQLEDNSKKVIEIE